jgi:methylmalonyl-CoA mutase C-terminal domain/subunit
MAECSKRGLGGICIFGGGIVPPEDAVELAKLGVQRIFTPGATTQEIVDWLNDNVHPREE